MFYYLYEYLSWYFSTQQEAKVEAEQNKEAEPKGEEAVILEDIKKQESPPVNIAALESEQEEINPVYSYLIYPKRTRSRRV